MMTMCRLLCALLVLALCCCPYVYAAQGAPAQVSSQTTTATTTEPQDSNKHTKPEDLSTKSVITAKTPVVDHKPEDDTHVTVTTLPSSPSEGEERKGKARPSGSVPASEQEDTARDEQTLNGPDSHSSVATSTLQSEGTDGTSGSQSRTSTAAEQATEEAKNPAQTTTTTTTTTKVPITSTTAPVAPSTTTTTTETPTTTTTRVPSRLREMDGSLSSSAWVCAPLLLAASALAYTAVN
ncbi:hypothetical protein ECC02_011428 [Trypanosoma cruzi]|uniref:Mucin TcMUCII n=1 Tax=Trypanosoma cruzi TaxID=5693 RepID=A0A7J6XMV2_TRYCR|nr:hypothetical protein ECC02_011428 [Trypanosoma cruzi]